MSRGASPRVLFLFGIFVCMLVSIMSCSGQCTMYLLFYVTSLFYI